MGQVSAVIRYFSAVCVLSHRGSMSDSPQGLSPLFHPRGKHLNWACVCSVSSWIYGSCVKAIGVALNQAIYSENRRCNHTERCLRSAPLARNQKSREPRCTQGEMGVAHRAAWAGIQALMLPVSRRSSFNTSCSAQILSDRLEGMYFHSDAGCNKGLQYWWPNPNLRSVRGRKSPKSYKGKMLSQKSCAAV